MRLKRNCYFSVSLHVSTEGVSGYLIDIAGTIHHQISQQWGIDINKKSLFSSHDLISHLSHTVRDLCQYQQINVTSLKTVCIATQGKIAQETGVILQSQLLIEQNVKFAQMLKDELNVEVFLYNIAYCSTFYLSINKTKANFIALLLGYGFGVGICVNNQVFLGPEGIAPEVSHLTYDRDGRECYCGSNGCAERYVTYNAIFDTLSSYENIQLAGTTPLEKLTSVKTLLLNDNQIGHNTIQEVGYVLGHVITQLISLFDIRTIYLNGETAILFDDLKYYISQYISQHNSYQLDGLNFSISYESDCDISTKGLLELTNRSYNV